MDGAAGHFIGSSGGTVTLGSAITATNINFDPPASSFTINTNANVLFLEGTGIVNDSGRTQTINNNAGGQTRFSATSSAGSATITNGGAVGGAVKGSTSFFGTSTAGTATITNNGGTVAGAFGGSTLFMDTSDGGTARAITNGNGGFDISGLTTAGMAIGSIEGSGDYFLGSKTLTVGGNDLSTTVSGTIQDGGNEGGVGGKLTKVGTGTLTLTGANTYSGGTNLNGGILAVNANANLGTGPLNFNGGTLEARAAGGGLTSAKGISLGLGGEPFWKTFSAAAPGLAPRASASA
jgi:autotransporter-associated beta strand protein